MTVLLCGSSQTHLGTLMPSGAVTASTPGGNPGLRGSIPYSDATVELIDAEVVGIIDDATTRPDACCESVVRNSTR
ncbi:hypothetical protein KTN05_17280 [Paracoccus sp. Z118]|uniref:hypothetical protein n=1 Tax=Paracoccus sp. Z118 TaxID=2851017 RepID=UPI001C2C73D1|nr:hypothetical protein [Paracoccus sp. Z118]MBV0893540.1 hypothetical protein [Paracoccus sp. Z118]